MTQRATALLIFLALLACAIFHHRLHIHGTGFALVIIGSLFAGYVAIAD